MSRTGRSHALIEAVGVTGLLAVLLVAYQRIFVHILVSPDGSMGHDYGLFLPTLLSGYFWYRANGLTEVPWFTSAQCGGLRPG